MIPNIGPLEIGIVLLIALIVFGPRKLPELGKSVGSGLREFRESVSGASEENVDSTQEKLEPTENKVESAR
ncbi:MAG: sec-independent protein translocase protein TatA [Actinomycetota bacterium]|nr:sec-independent protein translocase protein TatA [Actinomycetota bacterium]